jgi:hypothetical protein
MPTSFTNISIFPDGRMDAKNAASYVGLSVKTLAMMRSNGTSPKYIKRGRIFYYQDDLDFWLNEGGKCTSTAQQRMRGNHDV